MDRDDDRDESIIEARIAGTSSRALAKLHGCTSREVEEAIDRRLDYEVDNKMRLRAVKLSAVRLDALRVPFFEKAMKGDAQAGLLCVKIEERLALLFGLDQPLQSRVDVYQIPPPDAVSSHEKIRRTIMEFAARQPPAEREAHNLIGKIGGERALELLKAGAGNGDGAADVPSLPDATNGGSSDPQ